MEDKIRTYGINDDYIMSIEEQYEIVEWVKNNYLRLKKNGLNRYMKSMDEIPDIPDVVWEIKKRIVTKECLENDIQEPLFRDAIGYMMNKGQLHKHTDPNEHNLIHTRFNVYVQIPEKGGYPIYKECVLKLKERTYICCRSGLDEHYCEQVEGERERIVLSYGFLLNYNKIKNVKYEYD